MGYIVGLVVDTWRGALIYALIIELMSDSSQYSKNSRILLNPGVHNFLEFCKKSEFNDILEFLYSVALGMHSFIVMGVSCATGPLIAGLVVDLARNADFSHPYFMSYLFCMTSISVATLLLILYKFKSTE